MRVWHSGRAPSFQIGLQGFNSPYPLQYFCIMNNMEIYIARIFREGCEVCETVPIKASTQANAWTLAQLYNDYAVSVGGSAPIKDLSIWTMERWLEMAVDEEEEKKENRF